MFLSERAVVNFYHRCEDKCCGEGGETFQWNIIDSFYKKTQQYRRIPLGSSLRYISVKKAGSLTIWMSRDEPNQHTPERESRH